jgi:hypothetical protein
MKAFKSIFLVALATIICVLSAGCGTDADKIVGKWNTSIDMSSLLVDALSSSTTDMSEYMDIKDFNIDFTLEFKEDGSYKIQYDTDSIKTSLENVKDDVSKGMKKYLQATLSDNGDDISVDEAMEQMGMDFDTYFNMVFNTDTISSTLADNLDDEKGKYQIEDGKLYMSSGDKINKKKYKTYVFKSDDKLKLIKAVGEKDESATLAQEAFPLTLTREE